MMFVEDEIYKAIFVFCALDIVHVVQSVNSYNVTEVILRPGSTAELKCVVDKAANTIIWNRKFSPLSKNLTIFPYISDRKRLNIVNDGEFLNIQISNVSTADSDEYCCEIIALNNVTKQCSNLQIADISNISVIQPSEETILCNVSSVLGLYSFVRWKHTSVNGQIIRYILGQKNNTFSLNNVERQLQYTQDGRYTCQVKERLDVNGSLLNAGHIDFTSKGKPVCLQYKVKGLIPGDKGKGNSLLINIDVYGSTKTTSEWLLENERLNESWKYNITQTKSVTLMHMYDTTVEINSTTYRLKIENVTQDDLRGNYTIEVYNNHGEQNTCRIKVPVGDFPDTPRNVSVQRCHSRIRVHWQKGNDGGYDQMFFLVYREKYAKSWNNMPSIPSNESFGDISNAKDAEYLIYMYAENIIGKSKRTEVIKVERNSVSTFTTLSGIELYVLCISLCVVLFVGLSVIQPRCQRFSNGNTQIR